MGVDGCKIWANERAYGEVYQKLKLLETALWHVWEACFSCSYLENPTLQERKLRLSWTAYQPHVLWNHNFCKTVCKTRVDTASSATKIWHLPEDEKKYYKHYALRHIMHPMHWTPPGGALSAVLARHQQPPPAPPPARVAQVRYCGRWYPLVIAINDQCNLSGHPTNTTAMNGSSQPLALEGLIVRGSCQRMHSTGHSADNAEANPTGVGPAPRAPSDKVNLGLHLSSCCTICVDH